MMKKNNDVRTRMFRALVAFSALVFAVAVAASLLALVFSTRGEMRYDYKTLVQITQITEARLDSGEPAPFERFELFTENMDVFNSFVYAVVDRTTGGYVAPRDIAPWLKDFDYDNPAKSKGGEWPYFTARHNGKKYFSMCVDMEKYPYRIIMTTSFNYAFLLVWNTMGIFFLSVLALLSLILLIMWKVVLPRAEVSFKERNKAEVQLAQAAKLQNMAITHDFPKDPRCDVFGLLKTAREVGGDLYGCLLRDGKLYFIIGDVSDKGTPAAFVMFLLSSIVYPMMKSGNSPAEQIRALNSVLCDNPNYDMFCTGIVGYIDLDSREMHFINAGHTRMLVDGVLYESVPNLPIGVIRDYPYQPETVCLAAGSSIVLYTDGVTEERSAGTAEFFGEQRLVEWWGSEGSPLDARAACESLDATVEAWHAGAEQSDDRAILTIKIK